MAAFGLLATGFVPMRLEDCRVQLEDDFKAAFGQNIRLDDRSVNGQLIGVIAERISDVWAECEKAYAAAYLAGASGAALDDLVALAAISRRPASLSVVTLTLTGTNGTVIPAGSVSKDPETLERWVHLSSATIASGTATTTASPERTGPVQALTGTAFDIATPVAGWNSSVVAADAALGRDVETDAALRARYSLSMRSGGGSALEAIRAAILRLDDVTECLIVENETYATDDEGRPPKSFETVVRATVDVTVDQAIADTIWAGKPAGIKTYGSETGSVVDSHGDAQTVLWSRPTEVPIYIIAEYEPMAGFADDGEDLIQAELLDLASTFTIGKDVVPFEFLQHVETSLIRKLTLKVGTAPSPTSTEPLTIARTELATFDSARIDFLVV